MTPQPAPCTTFFGSTSTELGDAMQGQQVQKPSDDDFQSLLRLKRHFDKYAIKTFPDYKRVEDHLNQAISLFKENRLLRLPKLDLSTLESSSEDSDEVNSESELDPQAANSDLDLGAMSDGKMNKRRHSKDISICPRKSNRTRTENKRYGRGGGMGKEQKTNLLVSQHWGDADSFGSKFGFYQENTPQEQVPFFKDRPQQQYSDLGMLDSFQFDSVSPSFQLPQQSFNLDKVLSEFSELIQPNKVRPQAANSLSFGENLQMQQPIEIINANRLSTEDVMRIAGAQYVQSSVHHEDPLSMLMHPFGCDVTGLTEEETQDIQLARLLLASAEKVGNQQFERGSRLLTQCDHLSSSIGNPVQRVVSCFAEALRERIRRETGQHPWKSFGEKGRQVSNLEEAMKTLNPAVLECHQLLPFSQVLQFAGIQAIVEAVASAKRVHLIDFGIKSGAPWTILMQTFAERNDCPIEHMKITAVGTTSGQIEETGKRLISFATDLNLPFTYKVVTVSDMRDLKEELFDLDENEVVAVYSYMALRVMLHQPECLEALMRVIKNLKPCIMVVSEVEANHNSPVLMSRFIESLFYYSTYFDCIEVFMDRNNPNRRILEEVFLGLGIQNIVATEGTERTRRSVRIDTWRAFFRRFGLLETDLSLSSLYQANLIIKRFANRKFCTLDTNGKGLLVGWKGTPLHSLSAWKFN